MESDGGGISTREDGGRVESRAELIFEEKGHFPCSEECQGKQKEWPMNREAPALRPPEKAGWGQLPGVCPRWADCIKRSCHRLYLEKVTDFVASGRWKLAWDDICSLFRAQECLTMNRSARHLAAWWACQNNTPESSKEGKMPNLGRDWKLQEDDTLPSAHRFGSSSVMPLQRVAVFPFSFLSQNEDYFH